MIQKTEKDITLAEITKIIGLFKKNYGNYHYQCFSSKEKFIEKMKNDSLHFVYLVDDDKVVGFAGYYLRNNEKTSQKEIFLAHLLVDNDYRGQGLGTILENKRLNIVENIPSVDIIWASCVENPMKSVQMKLNRGFEIYGFRYNYRPNNSVNKNALVLVKKLNKNLKYENAITQLTRLSCVSNEKTQSNLNYYMKIEENKALLRTVCKISLFCEEGYIPVNSENLEKLKQMEGYISIHVSPFINGFDLLDSFIEKRHFYRLAYIPDSNTCNGLIEYEYLRNGIDVVFQDKNVSIEAKSFLTPIYKESINEYSNNLRAI